MRVSYKLPGKKTTADNCAVIILQPEDADDQKTLQRLRKEGFAFSWEGGDEEISCLKLLVSRR